MPVILSAVLTSHALDDTWFGVDADAARGGYAADLATEGIEQADIDDALADAAIAVVTFQSAAHARNHIIAVLGGDRATRCLAGLVSVLGADEAAEVHADEDLNATANFALDDDYDLDAANA